MRRCPHCGSGWILGRLVDTPKLAVPCLSCEWHDQPRDHVQGSSATARKVIRVTTVRDYVVVAGDLDRCDELAREFLERDFSDGSVLPATATRRSLVGGDYIAAIGPPTETSMELWVTVATPTVRGKCNVCESTKLAPTHCEDCGTYRQDV